MQRFTISESKKIREITNRLERISSPVLRLQAILQYSQIVDILSIGDTSTEREQELIAENDRLYMQLDKAGAAAIAEEQ